jgi:8-oxo-dGTP pyrophosphatase MutT (NUDIX family)
VLDDERRVLLFRFQLQPDGERFCWLTPGGGIETGESPAAAGARELHEEIGLAVTADDLGPVVATTGGRADLANMADELEDLFFCYRAGRHDVDTSAMEDLERRFVVGHRWFSADDLDAEADPVYPLGLAGLLRQLVAGHPPDSPVRLPWHH